MGDHIVARTPPKPNKYCNRCLLQWYAFTSYMEDRGGGWAGSEPDEDELDAMCRESHPWRFRD